MKFAGDKAFRFSEGVTLSGFLSGCDCKRIAIPENSALSDAEGARRIFCANLSGKRTVYFNYKVLGLMIFSFCAAFFAVLFYFSLDLVFKFFGR